MAGKTPLALPLAFTCGLAGLALLAPVRDNPRVLLAYLGAVLALLAWNVALVYDVSRRARSLVLEVALRKQHYVQACAQGAVLLYWGWYWPQVYQSAHFILAQLLFAYAFDMLLVWSRRDVYTLGFGPFPVVFSINLFLWFKPDWFFLQFAMIALGFAAKELIRWNKDGRRVHVFNPSSFPLAVFSLGLIAAGASDITWGREIASTQFYPPHMYLMLFLVALPGQFFFGVTTMTMSAVVATYVFGLLYFAATGIYFFYDSYIPIAVFLGMHLLFTDPSTSPQTDLGRMIYGALYGLSTVALYQWLGSSGMPTFYDKLLQVPLLNLSIIGIDRLARLRVLHAFDPSRLVSFVFRSPIRQAQGDPERLVEGSGHPEHRRGVAALTPRVRRLAYMSAWAVVFAAMIAARGVGDDHPGQWLPFWQQACAQGRSYACPYVADRELSFCRQGSGWACNEAGISHVALSQTGEDLRRLDPADAVEPFERGCELGFAAACRNLQAIRGEGGELVRAAPTLDDYPIILRGSKGRVREEDPSALYAMACRQGWPDTCGMV
jgi:hypothetical protein